MEPSDSLLRDASQAAASLSIIMSTERSMSMSTRDYLHPRSTATAPCLVTNETPPITECDRTAIVDWCYSLVDQCQFERETVASAMLLVDRFLSISGSAEARDALRCRERYQLVAIASLYICIKTNERVALSSSDFAKMSRGAYFSEEIEAMERCILQGLAWRIHTPTSIYVAHLILSLALPRVDLPESTWGFILDEVRFQTECAVRDYYLSIHRPSTIALAAIFNVLHQVSQKDRVAVIGALLPALDSRQFASPDVVAKAETALLCLIAANDGIDAEDTATVVSETTVMAKDI